MNANNVKLGQDNDFKVGSLNVRGFKQCYKTNFCFQFYKEK